MRASTSSSARSQRLSASRTWLGLGLALGLGLGLGEVAAAQRVAHLGRVDAAARVAVRLADGLSHGRRPMESARRCIRRIGNLEAIPLGSGAMARLWLAEHMHASCLHSVAKPPAFRGHPVGGDPVVALP